VASVPTVAVGGTTAVSPVSAPPAPAGGSCACVTAIPTSGAALLKDLGDVGNALGTLKVDKLDKDNGKIKKH
jgi:hypothetical protein